MNAFDHVLVLLSFVYALAVTHLLSRIGALYSARERVTFFGLQAQLMLVAILQVFFSWLELWPLRSTPSWDLLSIADQFFYAIALYFLCLVAAPEVRDEGAIDLRSYFWREYRTYYGLVFAAIILAMAGNFTFLKTDVQAFWIWQIGCLPAFVPIGIALISRSERAQWFAGYLLLTFILAANVILIWDIA
jgi:hypothetical protein